MSSRQLHHRGEHPAIWVEVDACDPELIFDHLGERFQVRQWPVRGRGREVLPR